MVEGYAVSFFYGRPYADDDGAKTRKVGNKNMKKKKTIFCVAMILLTALVMFFTVSYLAMPKGGPQYKSAEEKEKMLELERCLLRGVDVKQCTSLMGDKK
jgi:hypothetical protein